MTREDLIKIISESLERMQGYLLPYFDILKGFENKKDSYCDTDQGLRPLGAEAILQSELYHSLRKTLKKPYIVSREFKPFSKSELGMRDGLDLAIFSNISNLLSRPSEAKIWLELKLTGGKKYLQEAYLKDFNKQLNIASLYQSKRIELPEIMANIIFIESPKNYITKEDPETFLFGQTLPECLKAPDWFKKRFYEALLWREGGKWILKPVFP